jgi:hypothetical protein
MLDGTDWLMNWALFAAEAENVSRNNKNKIEQNLDVTMV